MIQQQQQLRPQSDDPATDATLAGEDSPLLQNDDRETTTRRSPLTLVLIAIMIFFLCIIAAQRMMSFGQGIRASTSSSVMMGSASTVSITDFSSAATKRSDGSVPVVVSSRLDPNFSCVVMDCVDMLYSDGDGADSSTTLDRPNHLRAASSMQWITNSRLVIVQDDTNFIALVDIDIVDDENEKQAALTIKDAYSISLPSSRGDRQFQKDRGNRKFKLDLEASIYVPKQYSPLDDEGFLLAFGSGSSDYRNVIILIREHLLHSCHHVNVDFQPVNTTYWSDYCGKDIKRLSSPLMAFYAPSLYESWRQQTEFSGSELNIEGAAFIPPASSSTTTTMDEAAAAKVRFFQRGNGAATKGLSPKSSTGEVIAEDLFRYMDSLLVLDGQETLFYQEEPKSTLPPYLSDVVNYDLGIVEGVKLTFTGSAPASLSSNRIFEKTEFVYIAGAEASPDATRDGAVVGTAMGLIKSFDFTKRDKSEYDTGLYNFLSYPNGTKFLHKTEGVTIPPGTGFWKRKDGAALTVLDMDDPNVPAQMCLVQLDYSS